MRPISNVVDVTNYVLLERNQPLHAFDLDRLAGAGIVVRLAEAGERMTTLDGVERMLDDTDLLICDGQRTPQAIAGIMGGATSEVASDTTRVLLESAYFERMGIARSSKRLRLRSESSARFERGIDPDGVAVHAARAMELLEEVASASVAPDAVDQYPQPHQRPQIHLRTSRVNRILGTSVTDHDIIEALRPLEIDVEGSGDDLVATPPSFRPDLEREIDLVEEVARRVGFDSMGRTVPTAGEQVGGLTRLQRDRRRVADALVGAGAAEVMAVPLVSAELLAHFGLSGAVEITNPLRADESVLRMALVPGLARAAALNASRDSSDVTLFELGTVFFPPEPGAVLPVAREHVAALVAGTVRRAPVEPDRAVDAFDATDLATVVLEALAVASPAFERDESPGWRPGHVARLLVDGRMVGRAGEIDPAVAAALGIAGVVVAFEADLGALVGAPRRDRMYVAPSPFPPAGVDLAFVVTDDVTAGAVSATLREAGGELVESIRVFDEFHRDELGASRRSVAFHVRFRAPDRTLTDADVAELRQRCIDAVVRAHGAELRG
jgi:phenylalanyl-tRNA synthetase beta chain